MAGPTESLATAKESFVQSFGERDLTIAEQLFELFVLNTPGPVCCRVGSIMTEFVCKFPQDKRLDASRLFLLCLEMVPRAADGFVDAYSLTEINESLLNICAKLGVEVPDPDPFWGIYFDTGRLARLGLHFTPSPPEDIQLYNPLFSAPVRGTASTVRIRSLTGEFSHGRAHSLGSGTGESRKKRRSRGNVMASQRGLAFIEHAIVYAYREGLALLGQSIINGELARAEETFDNLQMLELIYGAYYRLPTPQQAMRACLAKESSVAQVAWSRLLEERIDRCVEQCFHFADRPFSAVLADCQAAMGSGHVAAHA